MNKTILQSNDDYSLTLTVKRCAYPKDLYEVKFEKKFGLDSRMDDSDTYFLQKDAIAKLIEALNVEDMRVPKCDKCGFINNMEKEPPVIVCSACGELLTK